MYFILTKAGMTSQWQDLDFFSGTLFSTRLESSLVVSSDDLFGVDVVGRKRSGT